MDVGDDTSLLLFILCDNSHRCRFSFRIRSQVGDVGTVAVRMRQNDDACEAIHRLQRERPLPLHLLPARLAPLQQYGVTVFGLLEIASSTLEAPLSLGFPTSD